MKKSEIIEQVYKVLLDYLTPTLSKCGVSVKKMPDDLTIDVQRGAMALVFVSGFNLPAIAGGISKRQTALVKVEAYVIVLAVSERGPRSASWVIGKAIEALDGKSYLNLPITLDSPSYTSNSEGIWQHRLPVSLTIPYSSGNIEVEQAANKDLDW